MFVSLLISACCMTKTKLNKIWRFLYNSFFIIHPKYKFSNCNNTASLMQKSMSHNLTSSSLLSSPFHNTTLHYIAVSPLHPTFNLRYNLCWRIASWDNHFLFPGYGMGLPPLCIQTVQIYLQISKYLPINSLLFLATNPMS